MLTSADVVLQYGFDTLFNNEVNEGELAVLINGLEQRRTPRAAPSGPDPDEGQNMPKSLPQEWETLNVTG